MWASWLVAILGRGQVDLAETKTNAEMKTEKVVKTVHYMV